MSKMSKKVIGTVIVLAIIAGIAVAFHQFDLIGTIKKMHGG